ncbi:hypothetical protein HYW67_02180 [Candidatus Parcubacteria bacterium]|nr:hypothetical protein [Candidatus Parcubacteria bacterium]
MGIDGGGRPPVLPKRHPQPAGMVAAAAVSRDRSRPGWGWSGTVVRPLLSLAAP